MLQALRQTNPQKWGNQLFQSLLLPVASWGQYTQLMKIYISRRVGPVCSGSCHSTSSDFLLVPYSFAFCVVKANLICLCYSASPPHQYLWGAGDSLSSPWRTHFWPPLESAFKPFLARPHLLLLSPFVPYRVNRSSFFIFQQNQGPLSRRVTVKKKKRCILLKEIRGGRDFEFEEIVAAWNGGEGEEWWGAVVEIAQICMWLMLCLFNTNVLKIEKFKHFAFATPNCTSVLKVDYLCSVFSSVATIVRALCHLERWSAHPVRQFIYNTFWPIPL